MESMNDDRWDDRLADAARGYNQPPETPREEIWAGIQAGRQKGGKPGWNRILRFRRTALPPYRLVAWSAGIAALLALGIGIGRLTVHPGPTETATVINPVVTPRPDQLSVAMTLAATQHLTRAEALLTGFRAESRSGATASSFSGAAQDLLSTTRLLLDSPDLRDPRMRALLQELELVLAQITQLRAQHGPDEVDLITQGLNQRGLLPRLRSAIPAGPAARRAQGEL
jgi:hypothetical protein